MSGDSTPVQSPPGAPHPPAAPRSSSNPDGRLETERMEAWEHVADDPVRLHVAIAARLLREATAARAFSELVQAAREVSMTPLLAAALTRAGLEAGTASAAITLVRQALDDVDDEARPALRRAYVRLLRRSDDLEQAREHLAILLAEKPGDRRGRFLLNALLEREERWDELDASLEKEGREALKRGALRRASRSALRRARLWGERLQEPARAALRYAQAAQYAEQARDFDSAFLLRLLWLRALHQSQAPERAFAEAVETACKTADAVGRRDRVQALVRELRSGGSHPTQEMPAVGSARSALQPARRHSTQLELIAVADEVQAKGRPELAAVLAAAVQEGPDPASVRRLEAHYVARRSWRELAQLYRENAARAASPGQQAQELEKLAEVLESELDDAVGAARAYAEIVALTGDQRAVAEQVRLLQGRRDEVGIRRALDEGVAHALDGRARASALVLRAEDCVARKELARAQADFEEALRLAPGLPAAAAGLAELAAQQRDKVPTLRLRDALKAMPRRASGRSELHRRLARLADAPFQDKRLACAAWSEVLAELPEDAEALGRLPVLARALRDDPLLVTALRQALALHPRGPRARGLHLELVAALERLGRGDEGFEALRAAVRLEPGHREAWLALADRLEGREIWHEVAWALEHAATATEEGQARLGLWRRLAQVHRDRLDDEATAEVLEVRARRLQAELSAEPSEEGTAPEAEPFPVEPAAGLLGGPLLAPAPRAAVRPASPLPPPVIEDSLEAPAPAPDELETGDFDEVARLLGAEPAPLVPPPPAVLPGASKRRFLQVPAPAEPDDDWEGSNVARSEDSQSSDAEEIMEVGSADFELASEELRLGSPPAREEASARGSGTAELPLGDELELRPSWGPNLVKALGRERAALFERVRARPLESEGYRLLAEHYDTSADAAHASLMLEVALALDGDPNAMPRTPRLILSSADRAGLKHPSLRGPVGELLGLAGLALCRLYPTRGAPPSAQTEFRLDAGKGARPAADALLAAVRILGLRAPELSVAEDNGPPFALVFVTEPRMQVGRQVLKKPLPDAELRFFAGRALFTQSPDLLSLRSLRKEQLQRGFAVLGEVLAGQRSSAEHRVLRDGLPQRSFERLRALWPSHKGLEVSALMEGARHSANRAGLVVCGGIAPALEALRAKKALPAETTELVRFAVSERYLALRTRRLGA